MNFLDLPIEVGILILNYLDTKSKINAYNSCSGIREFFAPCHVKRLALSRSVIATARTFCHALFVDMGHHIRELNLSGVPDLTARTLKPHISNFIHLRTLDITFTDIYLPDLIEICPRYLKNLAVNFFKCPRRSRRDMVWDKCKELFKTKEFTSIHFVVFEFLDSDTPLMFLDGISLIQDLLVTVADNFRDFWDIEEVDVPFNHIDHYTINFSKLSYVFRDCRVTHKTAKCLRGVANLNFEQIEYIYIMYLEKIVVYVSPVFKSIFLVNCSDLRVETSSFLPLDFMLDGNIIFKAWNKRTTKFDEQFMKNVILELQDYFPSYICMHGRIKMKITNAPSDWYCIDACEGFEKLIDDLPEKVTLTDFCRKDGAVIRCNRPIRLTSNSKTLNNLTFLRLSNICIREDFFQILFSQCSKLETLDIYAEKRGRLGVFRGYTASLSKSIDLAERLKNVKMTSEDIEYETLFGTLSRCSTLENVHICEYERALGDHEIDVTSMLSMIERCGGLYSLFIEADMSPEQLTLLMSPLRQAAQARARDHLRIEVCDCYRGWNPFVDVFNPSPLHILD
ncbi:uncharacterized protein LOC114365903 [Ostrinia furnacalis]|uniref:uncharacterized protein LOC114365903 n=1 Tax=Ostrinia furnacalis TaxID=93504 RepID=UPI001039AD79|nr:uncharacterized protein LOC114365903 [Ostrinia furnacalis]